MRNIVQSVSQVVFLLIAFVAVIVFAYSVFTGKTTFETKDFMPLAAMTFGFYFGAKPSDISAGGSTK
jgi:hypothetical protein